MMLASAMVELVGIASFVPFAVLATSPEALSGSPTARTVMEFFPSEPGRRLVALGVVVLLLFIGGNLMRAWTHWACAKLVWEENERLSNELLGRYVRRPFTWFLGHNTSDLARDVVEEVGNLVQQIFMRVLSLVSKFFMAFFIAVGILVVDPIVAIVTVVSLVLAYSFLYSVLKRRIDDLGGMRLVFSQRHHKTVLEALSSVKEAKSARWTGFLEEHACLMADRRQLMILSSVLMELPLMLAETLAVAAILGVTIHFAATSADLQQAVARSVLYLVATIRITPLLQAIYCELVGFRFYLPVLERLEKELTSTESGDVSPSLCPAFERAIVLKDVRFAYPGGENESVRGVGLEIQQHQCVALVGPTGGGKTTLADILAGLLEPTAGTFTIDDEVLGPLERAAWRGCVGYVPQEIYLCDDTVLKNIALGVPLERIDRERVVRAAKLARIHDFIESELERGYDTPLGERGISLSGGQRQRLGIARALYDDPQLLIFDEATSALDNQTERAIMEALETLGRQKTMLLVAHRLSTVRKCDKIYFIKDGRVIAEGTYEQLARECADFQALLPHQSMSPGASLEA